MHSIWKSDNNLWIGSVLLPCGSQDWIAVIRLGEKHLSLLSHLAGPEIIFSTYGLCNLVGRLVFETVLPFNLGFPGTSNA